MKIVGECQSLLEKSDSRTIYKENCQNELITLRKKIKNRNTLVIFVSVEMYVLLVTWYMLTRLGYAMLRSKLQFTEA